MKGRKAVEGEGERIKKIHALRKYFDISNNRLISKIILSSEIFWVNREHYNTLEIWFKISPSYRMHNTYIHHRRANREPKKEQLIEYC